MMPKVRPELSTKGPLGNKGFSMDPNKTEQASHWKIQGTIQKEADSQYKSYMRGFMLDKIKEIPIR